MIATSDADTARLMASGVLVLLAVPGLALVHRCVDERKTLLTTLGPAVLALPALCLQWALFGYSLAYGPTRHGLIGGFAYAGLSGLMAEVRGRVPALAFVGFQMTSAVVTPTIIAVALAGRMKRSARLALVLFWSTLVYDPIAHFTWADGGWLARMGVLDFAGGNVVHLAAGVSGLVCAAFVRSAEASPPSRVRSRRTDAHAFVGAILLWCASFGLIEGNAVAGRGLGARALTAMALAVAGSVTGWMAGEWGREHGKPSAFGLVGAIVIGPVAVTGAGGYVVASTALAISFIAGALYSGTTLGLVSALMAGLLSITAAAGYVSPLVAFALAVVAGLVCYGAVLLREQVGRDQPRDALAIHALGGLTGVLLTGIFARAADGGRGVEGALFGNVRQLGVQLLACTVTAAYAGGATWLIMKLLDATIGVRDPRAGLPATAAPFVESSHAP